MMKVIGFWARWRRARFGLVRFGCWFVLFDSLCEAWLWVFKIFRWRSIVGSCSISFVMVKGIQNILVNHGYRCSKFSDEDEYLKCSFCFSFVVVSCSLSLHYGYFGLLLWVLESFICILVCFMSSWRWIFKTLSFLLFINKISHWLEGCCVQFIMDNGGF